MEKTDYAIRVDPAAWYSASDLRSLLGCDVNALAQEIKSGKLKSANKAGAILIAGADVLDWLGK